MKLRPSKRSFACGSFLRATAVLLAAMLAFTPVAVPAVAAPTPAPVEAWKGRLPITELGEDEAILHALNRLAYGPRPGDIERVKKMGLEKWIEQQLNPEAIDDSALAQRIDRFPTLAMSSAQLLDEFPNPAVAAARAGMTQEEYRRMLQERQGKGQGDMQQRRQNQGDPLARMGEMRNPQRIVAELSMAKLTRAVYSERQLNEVLVDFWFNHFNVFANKGADRWLVTSYERDVIRPHAMGKFREMLGATAKAPAMLFYLDNWMSADPEAAERLERQFNERRNRLNNLFGMRNPRQRDERMDRPGDRRGQLGQQRPGQNPNPQQMPPNQPPQPPQRLRRGLNENYSRELLELHTLGVDGGYTQQDVIEVARAFTGWTMQAPRRYPEFFFDSRFHDTKSKTVLGKKIEAGGMRDGEMILDMLSRHANTAKFISTKLARRFVADEPPAALVEKMSQSFLKTDGDITAVMRTMIYSPEFWARSAYRAKIKKPFELVASAVRALNGDAVVPLPLVQWSARIGEPLYLCQPPTGYSDKAEAWVNTGALLNRLNFALQLASGRMRGVQVRTTELLGDADEPSELVERAVGVFLAGQASPETRAVLAKQMSDPEILRMVSSSGMAGVDAVLVAGLVLGTPEFQRR